MSVSVRGRDFGVDTAYEASHWSGEDSNEDYLEHVSEIDRISGEIQKQLSDRRLWQVDECNTSALEDKVAELEDILSDIMVIKRESLCSNSGRRKSEEILKAYGFPVVERVA
ncbi:hypothetical protein FAI40_10225 [Acetobacteraceae bacterium]|nr:hypothetical protein FAI40_10225 [Acetobacteraceae bacterium]